MFTREGHPGKGRAGRGPSPEKRAVSPGGRTSRRTVGREVRVSREDPALEGLDTCTRER